MFRFDEAAKYVYQFVWHSYCDWYLEFLKPIFNSKNLEEINEAKLFSSYMMSNILKILHPFIPFFTETVWSKNKYKKIFKTDLISSTWPSYKILPKFNKNHKNINDLIILISNIRSTKAELKITPKLFCDLHLPKVSKNLNKLIKDNFRLLKNIGRVNNVFNEKINNQNSIDILVLKEKISLNFSEDIDLISQKQRILEKLEKLQKQINALNIKLKNKAYIKNAPKDIVENDKKLVKELIVEDNKLRSIVSSIN